MRTQPLIERDVLEDLYFRQRISIPNIALMTGTNVRYVRDSFTAAGLKWRTKSEARRGKKHSPAVRAKIAEARRGCKDTPEVAAKKRAVLKLHAGWSKGLTAATDERVAYRARATKEAMNRPEHRAMLSRRATERLRTGGSFDRGGYISEKAGCVGYHSGWELQRWKDLDANSEVVTWEVQPCSILYEWRGVRRYTPDALITYRDGTRVLEEIKPRKVIEYDNKHYGKIAAKFAAARIYCNERGWVFRVIDHVEVGR